MVDSVEPTECPVDNRPQEIDTSKDLKDIMLGDVDD